jgi:hypothetical protein
MTSAAAPDRPAEFACSARGGNYDEITHSGAGQAHRIRGTVMPLRYRVHDRSRPTATVQFRIRQPRGGVGLQLLRRGTTDRFDVTIVTAGSAGGRTSTKIGLLGLNQELAFELSARAGGQVSIQAGDRRVDLPVDVGTSPEISISCSTGAFRFRGLEWGGPPAS